MQNITAGTTNIDHKKIKSPPQRRTIEDTVGLQVDPARNVINSKVTIA